ncbi:hypothetical protein K491DRAFT_781130 [Lophiostoma macrostomum CBS 122681]|uniref:Uncharacterized protein n=1 Tax=Lophiostoma macrostomum CBS 122681 TaxID=1314788 RepID=A0A6A6SZ65_9PLEO|nr:hypothetical protein K491DRAFT_781130 [Lophiostoma macrostomum CBS 122681]
MGLSLSTIASPLTTALPLIKRTLPTTAPSESVELSSRDTDGDMDPSSTTALDEMEKFFDAAEYLPVLELESLLIPPSGQTLVLPDLDSLPDLPDLSLYEVTGADMDSNLHKEPVPNDDKHDEPTQPPKRRHATKSTPYMVSLVKLCVDKITEQCPSTSGYESPEMVLEELLSQLAHGGSELDATQATIRALVMIIQHLADDHDELKATNKELVASEEHCLNVIDWQYDIISELDDEVTESEQVIGRLQATRELLIPLLDGFTFMLSRQEPPHSDGYVGNLDWSAKGLGRVLGEVTEPQKLLECASEDDRAVSELTQHFSYLTLEHKPHEIALPATACESYDVVRPSLDVETFEEEELQGVIADSGTSQAIVEEEDEELENDDLIDCERLLLHNDGLKRTQLMWFSNVTWKDLFTLTQFEQELISVFPRLEEVLRVRLKLVRKTLRTLRKEKAQGVAINKELLEIVEDLKGQLTAIEEPGDEIIQKPIRNIREALRLSPLEEERYKKVPWVYDFFKKRLSLAQKFVGTLKQEHDERLSEASEISDQWRMSSKFWKERYESSARRSQASSCSRCASKTSVSSAGNSEEESSDSD